MSHRSPAPNSALWLTAACLLATVPTLPACNFTELAANQTVSVFQLGSAAFDKERDTDLAHAAALGNLKMFEGLLEVVPDNRDLLLLTSRSFATFTFGFVEDDLEQHEPFSDAAERELARAVDYYSRAFEYGSRAMALEHEEWPSVLAEPLDRLAEHIGTLEQEDAEALFWVAYPWGSRINLTADDPASVVDLPKVRALMERVVSLDETVYFGGAHLFLGAADATFPEALGGNPEGSKAHFERAIELTGGRYLMAKVLYAIYYHARQSRDRDAYRRLLEEVVATRGDVWPEQRLSNELARQRAARWLEREETVFE